MHLTTMKHQADHEKLVEAMNLILTMKILMNVQVQQLELSALVQI